MSQSSWLELEIEVKVWILVEVGDLKIHAIFMALALYMFTVHPLGIAPVCLRFTQALTPKCVRQLCHPHQFQAGRVFVDTEMC